MGTLILGLLIFYIILLNIFIHYLDTLINENNIIWYNSGERFSKGRDYIILKKNN